MKEARQAEGTSQHSDTIPVAETAFPAILCLRQKENLTWVFMGIVRYFCPILTKFGSFRHTE